VRYGKFETTACCGRSRPHAVWCGLLLVICVGAMGAVRAHGAVAGTYGDTSPEQMAIQVNDDRLTVTVARVPQIYLYGAIDAGAPARFEALVRSGKIPAGSDVYLNSTRGNLAAGLALGQLFRAGSMATHLGTPRRKGRTGYQGIKTAVCTGACAYAYFGGLYRWAPTGSDRIGLVPYPAMAATSSDTAQVSPSNNEVGAYLQKMGIDLGKLPPTPTSATDSPIWLTADQMRMTGLANNGRLPLTAKTGLLPPTPFLELNQDDRHGSHRLTLQCKPGNVTLTAYDLVGVTRAGQIVARATRSYFEVNRQEVLSQPRDGASVVDDAVVITRPYPPAELVHLLSAPSIGAWVGGRTDAFRHGFTFWLYPAKDAIVDFYNACWRAAPWPAKPSAGKG
jgi:hypothetical protein